MNPRLVLLATALMFAPTAQALIALPPLPELPDDVPRFIGETVVAQDTTFENGTWVVTGKITVLAGVTLRLLNVEFEFTRTSPGIELSPAATLVVDASRLRDPAGEFGARGPFRIVALVDSVLRMENSTLAGGQGMLVETNDTYLSANLFAQNSVGLFLREVALKVENNTFRDNDVAMNQTRGENVIRYNLFQNGQDCIRNWRTHPIIVYNVFDGCHLGILHEESHSVLAFNLMDDNSDPGGVGIHVRNTNSPVIEANDLSNWGTGILVDNARAYIRNNTIHDNVGDGIRIDRQSGEMDIQGNTIYRNGDDGIDLRNLRAAHRVWTFNNTIHNNTSDGIETTNAPNLWLATNVVDRNGGHGIVMAGSPDAHVEGNLVRDPRFAGIHIASDSPRANLTDNAVLRGDGNGIEVAGPQSVLVGTSVTSAGRVGMLVTAAGTTIDRAVVTDSGRVGIQLSGADGSTLSRAQSLGSGSIGVFVDQAAGVALDEVDASEGIDGFVTYDAGALMTCVRALNNLNDGLRAAGGAPPLVRDGWFQDNGAFGVLNLGAVPLDARLSYWGHPDGPSTPGNPTGGDRVGPNVVYDPFHASPSACALDQDLVRINVDGPDFVEAGATTRFTVRGFDRYGNELPLERDHVDFIAPTRTGTALVRYTEANVTGQRTVEVVAAPLAVITFDGPSEVVAGTTATYSLAGEDAYGNEVGLEQETLVFDAPTLAGPHTLTHTEGGVTGTRVVQVTPDALATLALDGPRQVDAGSTTTYFASGADQYGNVVPLVNETVVFEAPRRPAFVDVCVTEGGLTACVPVEVVVGPLARIVVSTDLPEVNPGRGTVLHARGYDAGDNEVPLSEVTWTASAGSITSAGAFVAPFAIGHVTVNATADGFTGTFLVNVTSRLVVSVATLSETYSFRQAYGNGIFGEARVAYTDGAPVKAADLFVFIVRDTSALPIAPPHRVVRIDGETNDAGLFRFTVPDGWTLPRSYSVRAFPSTVLEVGAAESRYVVTAA